MRSVLAAGFIVAVMAHLSFAGRTYTCTISVGSNLEEYDCTSIGDAVARMKKWPLDKEHLGQIRVYLGVYKECIGGLWCSKDDSRWLPKHCDLIGMGKEANDVVIEHPAGTGVNDYTIIASGDNVISHLKIYSNREARNGIHLFDDCTLEDCVVETIHLSVEGNANLVVRGCKIASMFGPCIRAYKSFSVSDCVLNPRGWYRHVENPIGIETYGPGSIDKVTIASTIKSSYWCTGAGLIGIMLNTGLEETVTISNVGMNLQLTSNYWPGEAGILRVCGIMNGIQWYEPTTNYKGRTIVRDCIIDVTGVEGSPDANGTPAAVMVDGVCVRGGGTIELMDGCMIKTDRTASGDSKDGYEYSLNNVNGILSADFNAVDFNHGKTNGVITTCASSKPDEQNEPANSTDTNRSPIIPSSLDKVLYGCGKMVSDSSAVFLSRENWKSFSFPDKDVNGFQRPFTPLAKEDSNGIPTGIDSIIEIGSDITTNQIWTPNNTYHVIADINVRAMLVIEPGTTVTFSSSGSMYVNNGGTIISVGTPDEPVIYTTDSTPGYGKYYCPLYIEETASASTKIMYSYIKYSYIGLMVLNNELENAIQDNYFYYNACGIVEYGTKHTDIRNNLVFASYYSGIEVFLESTTGQADANSEIVIENNTCDYYQDDGIRIHGVDSLDDAGLVIMANNIVSESYQYGLHFLDSGEYAYAIIMNTGYFDNASNKNWAFDEDNPAFETVFPYETGTGVMPICFLKQDCNFINVGCQYIEQTHLIGKTSDVDSAPDCNFTDIGFHYPNWNFSNPGSGDSLVADLDDNMQVDFNDFALFSGYWKQSTSGEADLDDSGFVDYRDLRILAGQWLQFADPNIQIQTSGDSNEGYIEVGTEGFMDSAKRIFLLVDGEYVGEIFDFWGGDNLTIDISKYGGGERQFKTVSINSNNRITCSNITDITFSCPLKCCLLPDSYEPNKPLYFSAFNPSAGNVSVKAYANGGNLVWSQTYSGTGIFGSIPASITRQYEFDYVGFVTSGGALLLADNEIAKVTDPVEPPRTANVQALIIVPPLGIRIKDYRTIGHVRAAFEARGIDYVLLSRKKATYNNVAWYAGNKNIKYMFIDAHGGFGKDPDTGKYVFPNNVLRTYVNLYDVSVLSIKKSDFGSGGEPSWCKDLGWYWETITQSFYSMGFNALEFAYFNSCYSGRLKINAENQLVEGQPGQIGVFDGPHSDMSLALGIGEPSRSRVYQGWYDRYWFSLYGTDYQQWTQDEWQKLGEGDNLVQAITYAISQQTDFGPYAPVNNYRLKGQGYIWEIILQD